jgi:hypothetical protein
VRDGVVNKVIVDGPPAIDTAELVIACSGTRGGPVSVDEDVHRESTAKVEEAGTPRRRS